jgi:membrane AbrB-like protein
MNRTDTRPDEQETWSRKTRTALRWAAVGATAYGASAVADRLGVPAPYLLAPLVFGMVVALCRRRVDRFPAPVHRLSQALVGVVMGSYLAPGSLQQVAPAVLPLLLVTLGTVLVSLAAAYALARTGLVSHHTAALGMAPGGSAAIVSAAEDLAADSRIVAFTQYLRVAVVAISAPLVVHGSTGGHAGPAGPHVSAGPDDVASLLVLVGVLTIGVRAGECLRLPAPYLLGPMLVAAVAVFGGVGGDFVPTGIVRDLTFVAVGLEVGLRFTRASVLHARRLFWPVLAATVAVSTACAGLAWWLARATGIPVVDAYLATTPGGINAVLATAVATHADVPLVSSVQSLRLFAVVLIAPPLIRLFLRTVQRRADGRPASSRVG